MGPQREDSLRGFHGRRAVRLLPALAAVMVGDVVDAMLTGYPVATGLRGPWERAVEPTARSDRLDSTTPPVRAGQEVARYHRATGAGEP